MVELAELAEGVRRLEARMIAVIGQIVAESDEVGSDESLACRHGFRTTVDLVEGVVGCKARTAHTMVAVAKATRQKTSLTGQPIDPEFSAVGDAFVRGFISIESASAIVSTLRPARLRASVDDFAAAERGLVELATGRGSESLELCACVDRANCECDPSDDLPTPVMPSDLVQHAARLWRDRIDPDGVEPRADEAHRRRGLRVSRRAIDGLHRVSGALPPDLAARFHAALDALINSGTRADVAAWGDCAAGNGNVALPGPSTGGDQGTLRGVGDESGSIGLESRSRDQLGADLFAAMLTSIAASDTFASPPTVLVTISGDATGRPAGSVGRIVNEPVARSVIEQMACDGGTQEVLLGANGRIVSLGIAGRFFSAQQRRAIAARDGHTCLVPTCTIPAAGCEAHHVQRASLGGKTHVDNGVLLCWAHHRMIDNGSWRITMIRGVPRVRHLPPKPTYPLRT
ncbi:HNH endonuclease [Rarobacter faecitabidus]|uniref:HNH endonuclease n=1 Tax=Rarobacter faecitabidus TaxID=13243 RepID=UPI0014773127|nr:HNH endonuclease signature motif containing protein [Rarobacter faecitabidus]